MRLRCGSLERLDLAAAVGAARRTDVVRALGLMALRALDERRRPEPLVGAALVFSVGLGLAFGVVSATWPESIIDRVVKVLAITGQSMPAFWLGLLFILLFTVYLGWLPSAGGPERVGLKGLIMPATSLGWFLVAVATWRAVSCPSITR